MSKDAILNECDVILVGAGIMSSTLGTLLKELDASLTIQVFEKLNDVAKESSDAFNNAGTGHSAFCELNYTPESIDGTVDVSKALVINEQYELSLQFWAYLIQKSSLPAPSNFMNPVPHVSFVWGKENVRFLRARFEGLTAHPLFSGMEYSEDHEMLKKWIPLVMEGRDPNQKIAATFVSRGTDVNFGALTKLMFCNLEMKESFRLHLDQSVTNLKKQSDGRWLVTVKDRSGATSLIKAKFVFLGAGGGALPLLIKSGIPEGRGYGGFPVSGQWLICTNPLVVERHSAKVYGKAEVGAPPMSVPHLDTRIIDGKKALLFGPYAGFSTKFLKEGSYLDLPLSLNLDNLIPMMAVGLNNFDLTQYLIGQCLQTSADRVKALRDYFPEVNSKDWKLEIAGQRVQIIKKDPKNGGKLEFGTEVVSSADGSIAALLGASPGASTAVHAMVTLIERCFAEKVASESWKVSLQKMIPSYGQSLVTTPELVSSVRSRTNSVLGLK